MAKPSDEIAARMEDRMERARIRAIATLRTLRGIDGPPVDDSADAVELLSHCMCVFALDEMILETAGGRKIVRRKGN